MPSDGILPILFIDCNNFCCRNNRKLRLIGNYHEIDLHTNPTYQYNKADITQDAQQPSQGKSSGSGML